MSNLIHGGYSGLAKMYDQHRPAYSQNVLTAILSLLSKPFKECQVVDVGAGTGIWTRMVAKHGFKNIIAVEPNKEMRGMGRAHNDSRIVWQEGSGEETGLEDESCDMVSMASSFHWVDFDAGIKEFHRILKDKGIFVSLWNPRHLEINPLLLEIEQELKNLKPDLTRVSSGSSGVTENLTQRLHESLLFEDIVYIEGYHTVHMTPDRYIGTWRSVNDVQFQLGEEKFESFLSFIRKKTAHMKHIEATIKTRAWVAIKSGH